MFDMPMKPAAKPRRVHEFAPKLGVLFQPKRYKILYGGRGGGKSMGVANALLLLGAQEKHRILCLREFQNSIKDSVHKLLSDQIVELGLEHAYDIQQTTIKNKTTGTEFLFEGLRHNATKLKSFQGTTIAWVEEGQFVSKSSWETLIPTIRTDWVDGQGRNRHPEIWVTFNPDMDSDETYKRFVADKSDDTVVVKINWSDNPWFPDVLLAEKDKLKLRDYDAYLNVWEGHCRQAVEGAIYARELRDATEGNRITKIDYDRSLPVHTFWDIGWSDLTAILFVQFAPFETRVIDYHCDRHKTLVDYLKVLQGKGYLYGGDWLPHDAKAKDIKSGTSVEALMVKAGRRVNIVPNLSIQDGINAARTMFPQLWFDQVKCSEFLQTLRHYKYHVNPETGQYSKLPEHDIASHGADALRMLAVSKGAQKGTYKAKPQLMRKVIW